MSRFPECVAFVLEQEGGYCDRQGDKGGPTNHGITQADYDRWRAQLGLHPEDVKGISEETTRTIYRVDYWDAIRGDALPAPLDMALMDFAVNSGVGRAVLSLQRLLQIRSDGEVGVGTLEAIRRGNPLELTKALIDAREEFLRSIAVGDKEQFLETEWLPRLRRLRAAVGLLQEERRV